MSDPNAPFRDYATNELVDWESLGQYPVIASGSIGESGPIRLAFADSSAFEEWLRQSALSSQAGAFIDRGARSLAKAAELSPEELIHAANELQRRTHEQLHAFAEQNGLDPEKTETISRALAEGALPEELEGDYVTLYDQHYRKGSSTFFGGAPIPDLTPMGWARRARSYFLLFEECTFFDQPASKETSTTGLDCLSEWRTCFPLT
jgi:hypothetical protein